MRNTFLSHSFQGLAKYPQNILYGVAIKHTINTHLVGPVVASGDQVDAFRVVWRVGGLDELAHAWDTITSQRRLYDQIVAQSPSLQMFVSCISGVFSKNIGAGPECRPIYPAVSYWTVFEGRDAGAYGDMTRRLFSVCPSAEVKPIKSLRHSDESLSPDCGPLFVTLKDHAGSFVMQKINSSLLVVGAPGVSPHPPNARLVVTSRGKYIREMPETVSALQLAGLRISMDISEET